jgi:serine/threonine protein kinase
MSQSPERYHRARALFEQIRSLPTERQAMALAGACDGDSALQRDVTRLLAAATNAGSFLEHGVSRALTPLASLEGRRLGAYEVRESIGAGGMGQVYRAHDTILRRDVALKVLPDLFADDPDRLARFDREAQVLATLNHPYIAAIYGLEQSGGVRALVLELVEGPTLADRITHGPIPLDQAIAAARQIAAALEAAHERAIIHRDLKPANIKLREDGTIKVLDFGLAKALDTSTRNDAVPHRDRAPAATLAAPGETLAGMLLGTAAYMSPEQATGRSVDKRTDIWAFGCVLFEMLTGRPAFGGMDVADTLASIQTKDPDWTLLPRTTPSSIHRLLRRCLEKDRRQRLADCADARLELDEAQDESLAHDPSRSETAQPRVRRWSPWSIAGAASLLTALTITAAPFVNRQAVEDPAVSRTSILLPGRLGGFTDIRGSAIALAPDGRRLAFAAADTTGRTRLWLRALDSVTARPLNGTDDARTPFWSPDGRSIAFVANDTLKKIDVSSETVFTLCGSAWAGGTWSRDDVILFTTTSYALARVQASGGTASNVTMLDFARSEWGHVSPSFLPDARHFVYAAVLATGQPVGVYVASVEGGERTRLPLEAGAVQYARGLLWFERGGTLMAQPFASAERRLAGNAIPLADELRTLRHASLFSVSEAGTLAFQSNPSPGYDLTWFDRTGRAMGTLGTRDDYADVSLSPDGRRATVSVGQPGSSNRDLWIFDVTRGVRTRLTSGSTPETHNVWSPDGAHVVFDSRSPGQFGLFRKRSDGTGDADVLLADALDNNPTAWSPDGRFLMYVKRSGGASNLWVLPLAGDRTPFPFTNTQFNVPAQFAPDGRWVVYGSSDSGRMEIYVAPFPGPGARTLVSTAGGWDPRWRRDGKEIVYLDFARTRLMSAKVTTDHRQFEVTEVKPLFELPKIGPRYSYDLAADGQRILAVAESHEAASAPLTLVLNWPALLNR